jgi:LAO/AO transport system kinase
VTTESLIAGLKSGDRRALARAITLVESRNPGDRAAAGALLRDIAAHAGHAVRLGISGAPGVGKSTFIEALGLYLIGLGHRVAVLAIDPSSTVSGGSILGDKTRMERLATHDAAFIRPTPSAGMLGGIAAGTRAALLLCEAAGYDVVLVETVGVGQSELAVRGIVDLLLLLLQPHAGDELQAMKRGVMEVADLVIVNKADLDPQATNRAVLQVAGGRLSQGAALAVSSTTGAGIAEVWTQVELILSAQKATAAVTGRRGPGPAANARPFRILGMQQVAIGSTSKERLRTLWVDLLGLEVSGSYMNERENVDEDICRLGHGAQAIELDLMQPLDAGRKPAVQTPSLNHIGLWVDDLPAAVEWLGARGLRFAPGGIRKGAAGHDVCFIHPKASEEFPLAGEGVLIELVQAPPEIIGAFQA